MPQGLEGDGSAAPDLVGVVLAAQPKRMMRAAHRQHRGTGGIALVEDIDLGLGIAAELHCKQRQQHRFAGAGRPDEQHMPHVADMG